MHDRRSHGLLTIKAIGAPRRLGRGMSVAWLRPFVLRRAGRSDEAYRFDASRDVACGQRVIVVVSCASDPALALAREWADAGAWITLVWLYSDFYLYGVPTIMGPTTAIDIPRCCAEQGAALASTLIPESALSRYVVVSRGERSRLLQLINVSSPTCIIAGGLPARVMRLLRKTELPLFRCTAAAIGTTVPLPKKSI